MSSQDCQICSIRSTCAEDTMCLYAPTEILSHRVESVLVNEGIAFSSSSQTFVLPNKAERGKLLKVLRSELSQPEADELRVTFDLSSLMAAVSLTCVLQRSDTRWFEDALVHDRFVHWYQPILNVREQSVIGHECLIRLAKADEPGRFFNGQEILDAAVSRGDLHIFDSYSRRTAIRHAARQYTAGRMFINFTPSSIYNPAFCMASTMEAMRQTNFRPADIVFEIIEGEEVRDPGHLRKIVNYYREQGFGVALDDVGTGSNSLQMMSDIRPDFIKLDKSIVWNYGSPIGSKTIRKLAEIGAETNIAVIAEGVETAEMRDVLLDCGIELMQGYFFGKPAPAMLPA